MSKLHDRRSNKWALLMEINDRLVNYYIKAGDCNGWKIAINFKYKCKLIKRFNDDGAAPVKLLTSLAADTCMAVRLRKRIDESFTPGV